jgi:hypothetical protein
MYWKNEDGNLTENRKRRKILYDKRYLMEVGYTKGSKSITV